MKKGLFIVGLAFLYWGGLFAQNVINVSHSAFTVRDLDSSIAFMQETVMALLVDRKKVASKELPLLFGIQDSDLSLEIATLKIGNETIKLLEFKSSSQGREIPHDSKSNDLWFQHIAIVVMHMEGAYQKVNGKKVEYVSTAPQILPEYIPAAAGISAFYFRDRDDHNMELIYFPKGKGNPKWQENDEQLFLGIDHTAIGISDTEQSLKFYRDILGLKVAGDSENYGPEQEHLNQVFGARLLITGLHAPKGIGVEFLDYIAPPGGRSYPKDSSPLDLWHWHTAMQVDTIEGVLKNLEENGFPTISVGVQNLPELGFLKAAMVRDPDGHAILLYE